MKILLIFFLSLMPLIASPAAAFDLRIGSGRISLAAEQVPLQDILKRFSERGIEVRIDPQINPPVTVSFEDLEMQEGLDTLLKSLSHILIWEAPANGKKDELRLTEIQIFQPGRKEYMKPLESGFVFPLDSDPKTGALFVKNELLIALKPGVSFTEFQNLLSRIGGVITGRYSATGVYRIGFRDGADIPALVMEIAEYKEVAGAEPNYVYPVFNPFASSGQTSPELPERSAPEGAAPIAIIDTGFSSEAGDGLEKLVLATLDSLSPGSPISDNQGHGTQMAYIASGLIKPAGVEDDQSPGIPLIPIRGFDDNGFISGFQLMQGIEFAIANGARVLSLSWGGETYSGFMETAFKEAQSKGLIVVASAGNEPTGKAVYPAAYPSVIGVGALDRDGNVWSQSNFGSAVSLYAPGVASLPVGYKGDPGSYSGTSIAADFTVNRIALYLSVHPAAGIDEILNALAPGKEP